MITNKNLIGYSNQSIREILELIDLNSRGICFIADSVDSPKIIGLVTDGDIRRAILSGCDTNHLVSKVMNERFISLNFRSSESLIRSRFSDEIKIIPLLDDNGVLVGIADALKSHAIPVLEPDLSGNEVKYVLDCIESNWISSQGRYVTRFEREFENLHQEMFALAVSNGTVALHLALMTLGIGPDDEVIVPNITFAATINAVLYCGATPVICEIDPISWCIDIEAIKKLTTPKTKAIIPVHLYGQVCDMPDLALFAESKNIYIIEDCAESLGSVINGRLVGTFGDASTFSFFGNKTISTGEGGMVLFKNEEHFYNAKILRDHGMAPSKRYWHDVVGYNFRLTNLQAAIGVAQMERFESIIERKRKIAELYGTLLKGVIGIDQLPYEAMGTIHSNWLYTIKLSSGVNRDEVVKKLLQYGIETRPVFYPLSEMPPYQKFRCSANLDTGLSLSMQGISLPTSATINVEKINYVSKALNEVLSEIAC
jgi:perosamine synthetase